MSRTDASEPGTQRSSYLVRPLFPLALATFAVGTDAFGFQVGAGKEGLFVGDPLAAGGQDRVRGLRGGLG